MGSIQKLSIDESNNRQLFALHLSHFNQLPDLFELSTKYFACLLCWDSSKVAVEEISYVANALMKSGAVYFCTWGKGCERLHDIIDENICDLDSSLGKSFHISTSWHDKESLEETLWYFLKCTTPAFGPQADQVSGLVISIEASPEIFEKINFALKYPQEFNKLVMDAKEE